MRSISDYTIYCTKEQTKKALELGAPIEKKEIQLCDNARFFFWYKGVYYNYTTAEQLIGWLEDQEPIKEIAIYRYERLARRYWCYDIFDKKGYSLLTDEECFPNHGEGYSSRKEATLAAIDAALDYLIKNKK